MKQTSSLKKSILILNSLLSPVVIAFLLDVLPTKTIWGQLLLLFSIPAKVILYSGIYGIYLEMISGEEIVFSFNRFKNNAKKWWKAYIVLSIVPFLIHFILFKSLNNNTITINLITNHLDLLLLAIISSYIISKKYLGPLNIKKKEIVIRNTDFLIILLLTILNISFFYIPKFTALIGLDLHRILIFLIKYLRFLSFIYFSTLIMSNYPDLKKNFTYDKELTLINPYPYSGGLIASFGYVLWGWYPPVFVVLKALTPKIYKIREFNQVIWQDKYYKSNTLVAITCFTTNSYEAYKLAKEYKKRGATVIMGGPHVTYMPDEALTYCDSVVIGEAEGVWKGVIHDYENNKLKDKYFGDPVDDYPPEIHQELLKSSPKVIKGFLETTRGCKYKCNFCSIPSLCSRIRKKPTNDLIELIQIVKNKYKSIYFMDCNLYTDPSHAKEVFKALIPHKIKWSAGCSFDIAMNDEALQLAKESGCIGLGFGYEVPGNSLEQSTEGKLALSDKYIDYTKKVRKMGIKAKGSFIWGWEADKYSSLFRLWKFCFRLKPWLTALAVLTPIPGSKFYNDMVKQNRIINLNWRKYAMNHLVFKHQNMNDFFVSLIFPIFSFFVFLTTSAVGQMLSFFIIVLLGYLKLQSILH